jgi:hypothetical protein
MVMSRPSSPVIGSTSSRTEWNEGALDMIQTPRVMVLDRHRSINAMVETVFKTLSRLSFI